MLTTLQNVKARLGIVEADVKDDALLTSYIAGVSGRFYQECNRKFDYQVGVFQDFQGDETELRLERYPLDESEDISFQLMVRRSDGWEDITDAEYVLRGGCIVSLFRAIGGYKATLRLTYSGGFILPTSDPQLAIDHPNVPTLPDELLVAANEQVAWFYQQKDRLGVTGMSGQGGGFTQYGKLDLLPPVAALLSQYKRLMA